MKFISLVVKQSSKTEKWKVHGWGQPDYHIMDWAGCNYRIMGVGEGQPMRGFDTMAQALDWAFKTFPTEEDAKRYIHGKEGDGTFWSGDDEEWESVSYRKREKRDKFIAQIGDLQEVKKGKK